MELCELAASEQNGDKFFELVTQISQLLKEKEDRFKTLCPICGNQVSLAKCVSEEAGKPVHEKSSMIRLGKNQT